MTSKAAILIDGGFFLKRLPVVRPDVINHDAEAVAKVIQGLAASHMDQLNRVCRVPHRSQLHYRTFCYDAAPYEQKAHKPVSNGPLNKNYWRKPMSGSTSISMK